MNIFWNKLWHTTSQYSQFTAQDQIISYFFFLLVYYGIYNYTLFFINKYWNLIHYKNYMDNILHIFLFYYRHQILKNKYNNADIFYLIRNKRRIIYPMRLWIFRYQSWLVINWFIFQPLKLKTKFNRKLKNINYFYFKKLMFTMIKRLNYLLIVSKVSYINKLSYYNF